MPVEDKQHWLPPPALIIFIDKQSTRSTCAVRHLRRHLQDLALPQDALVVYDIKEDIDMAIRYRVLATPTLIRTDISPPSRLIGDLENGQRVLSFLTFLP